MSHSRYVSDLKLCLELLSRFEIYPDLQQLEHFLADETHLELLDEYGKQLKQAWKKSLDVYAMTGSPLKDCQSYSVSLEKHTDADLTGFKNLSGLTDSLPESEVVKTPPPTKPLICFKLPNATVGKPYQGQLEWTSTKKISILGINGLDGLGLLYDLLSNTLSGEPEKAGEYNLSIRYQEAEDLLQALQTVELRLVINSNPKSLWKNIPSDSNVAFWKADSDYQGKEGLYGWKLAAASQRGRSHAHVGSCRDDDFALQVDKETLWQIVTVADGAGSSEFSREGARIIAHNSAEVLGSQLQQANIMLDPLIERWQLERTPDHEAALQQALVDIFHIALASSIAAITELAQQQQVSYRDFYSTLLIAAHKSFPKGEFTTAYWIGDGGLALYSTGQSVELFGVSDSGEYAGQTRFLDKNALERDDLSKRLHISSEKNFTALLLMTDGITDPLFETDNNLRDLSYWDALWQQIQPQLDDNPERSAQQLTVWLDFWSPGNHDDRTIALIYR
jgi:serine/threonine protein phosphatase PrpC